MDQSTQPNQPNQPNIPQESQQAQPSIQPEMPQKSGLPAWASVLIVVLSVMIVGLISYGAYHYFAPQSEPVELPTAGEEEPAEEPTDQTADWQTYRNEEYGFELKYPEDWKTEEIFSDAQSMPIAVGNEDYDYVKYTIFSPVSEDFFIHFGLRREDEKNIRVHYDMGTGLGGGVRVDDDILVGGISTKVRYTIDEGYIYCIQFLEEPIIVDGHEIFIHVDTNFPFPGFKADSTELKTIKLILSTFKFIEADTADWQTYRNEEYGFEVRYPKDWDYKKGMGYTIGAIYDKEGNVMIANNSWSRNLNIQGETFEEAIKNDEPRMFIGEEKSELITYQKIIDDNKTIGFLSEWKTWSMGAWSRGEGPIIAIVGDFEDKTKSSFTLGNHDVYKKVISFALITESYREEFDQILSTFKFID